MEAAKAGGDRQVLHEAIREAALEAYDALARGGDNPLPRLLADDARIAALIDPAEVRALLDPTRYVGDAPERARALAKRIDGLPAFPQPRVAGRAVNKGQEVARGKTKVLHESPEQPDVLVVSQLDNISAGDGARRNTIEGKGRLAAITTSRIFRLLNLCGLPTHYLAAAKTTTTTRCASGARR